MRSRVLLSHILARPRSVRDRPRARAPLRQTLAVAPRRPAAFRRSCSCPCVTPLAEIVRLRGVPINCGAGEGHRGVGEGARDPHGIPREEGGDPREEFLPHALGQRHARGGADDLAVLATIAFALAFAVNSSSSTDRFRFSLIDSRSRSSSRSVLAC